jgi:hypothetical protein
MAWRLNSAVLQFQHCAKLDPGGGGDDNSCGFPLSAHCCTPPPSTPNWPVLTSTWCLSLRKVITMKILVNRTVRQLEADVEGVSPWDLFLWPQYGQKWPITEGIPLVGMLSDPPSQSRPGHSSVENSPEPLRKDMKSWGQLVMLRSE